jgi:hypothetical protein
LAWATAVVQSSPSNITAAEWIGLAGIFVTTALVWLVPNGEPASG